MPAAKPEPARCHPLNQPADTVQIPYIGRNGRPLHRVTESQRRWYTKNMTEAEASELMLYFEEIESRVQHYQSERVAIRAKSVKLLTFSEGTPIEERQSRLKEVDDLRAQYVEYLENIVALKATVVEYTPGEPLTLEPLL